MFVGDSDAQNAPEHTVLFDLDSSELRPDEETSFRTWLNNFSGDTVRKLEVIGHTDHLGTEAYNMALSERRANTVLQWIGRTEMLNYRLSLVSARGEELSTLTPSTVNGIPSDRKVVVRLHPTDGASDAEKLVSAEVGESIVLGKLNFIGGRHFLLPEARPELIKLKEIMHENPTLKIEIQGHICCKYDSIDGLDVDTRVYDLSLARARFIFEQLVESGIDQFRVRFRGFGSTHPLVYPELTEADRTANRRVEIKVLDK